MGKPLGSGIPLRTIKAVMAGRNRRGEWQCATCSRTFPNGKPKRHRVRGRGWPNPVCKGERDILDV